MASNMTSTPTPKSDGLRRRNLIRTDESLDNDPMMVLRWYHPHLTRHSADCMLIDNAPEGSYLLRPGSENDGSYVLSVKLSSSVQHIKVQKALTGGYKFGASTFQTVESLRKHFELEKPVIGSDSGVTVILKFPYTRYVKESHLYTEVVHHAVTYMVDSSSETEDTPDELTETASKTLSLSSREGYLTKLGRIRKSWRVRWFVLRNYVLSYYKTKQSSKPIQTLDLRTATVVEFDETKGKNFCFRIEFQRRTLYMYANSAEDREQWVELLRSKLE